MKLVRLAFLEIKGGIGNFENVQLKVNDLKIGSPRKTPKEDVYLLPAKVDLKHHPKQTRDRLIVVPERPRIRSEHALEHYRNLVNVCQMVDTRLSSAIPPVALEPENESDEAFLRESRGFLSKNADNAVYEGHWTLDLSQHLSILKDRLDGVAILSEAISQKHATGRFHELIRLFERAFGVGNHPLIGPLSGFLVKAPHQGFSGQEIKSWLKKRDGVTHADKRESILYESNVSNVTGRMLQAAYEVLMNKAVWRTADQDRTERWRMPCGMSSPEADKFGVLGLEWRYGMQILDEFKRFPSNLEGVLHPIPDAWWSAEFYTKEAVEPRRRIASGSLRVI